MDEAEAGNGLRLDITHLRDGFTVEMADDLRQKMQTHPARESSARWERLQRSLGAHNLNVKVLENYLDKQEREAGWVLHTDFVYVVLAYLTNYVSTARMVVDHARNFIAYYEGSAFAAEYETRVKVVAARPDVQLVHGLRNYILHARSPRISIETMEDSFGRRSVIMLNSASLLEEWSDMPSRVKAYLRSVPAIRIIDEVRGYRSASESLYRDWLLPQFPILHGEEIDDFNSLVIQLQGMYETVATTGFGGDDGILDFRWNREP